MQDNRLRASLGHALVRLFRMVNREHGRALTRLGVSAEQAHILSVLWIEGPCSVGELGRAVALSSATLTGALDRMEAQGMIRRVTAPDDARSFVIEPTIGTRQRERIEGSLDATEALCFAGLARGERQELLRLLEKTARLIPVTPPRRRRGSR